LKNAFVIVTLSGLLAACASAPVAVLGPAPAAAAAAADAPVAAQAPEGTAGAGAEAAPEAEAAASKEKLPNVALSGPLLYKLMKAELELDRKSVV
jgi:hypothetical protein